MNKKILLTGGAGFFGELLKTKLLEEGCEVVSIDLEKDETRHPNLTVIQGDIRNLATLEELATKYQFDAILHIAAILAHATINIDHLITSNVDGTRNIAKIAEKYGIKKVVFTSSNCLWGESFHRPVLETDIPKPVELYGETKRKGEVIFQEHSHAFKTVIFRCPTIVDAGRLGLLAILFEFIDEGRKVWVVGGGENRYQFIYAGDLIDACLKALDVKGLSGCDIYNIGSDSVPTFKEAYSFVIQKSGNSRAKVANFPRCLAIPLMKIAYALKLSPLGPYQYKMIAEDFEFDTAKIKKELGWRPTLTNGEMLYKAYNYYHQNLEGIKNRTNVSAHKQSAKMGIIRLLKWLS